MELCIARLMLVSTAELEDRMAALKPYGDGASDGK